MKNVYNEFKRHTDKIGIKEFRHREISKNYAFEREGTPLSSDYLEVRYSAADPPIDPNYNGPATEAVFGTSVNPLELFLVERNIMGPCWLDIKAPLPIENPFSWCKVQVSLIF